VSSQGHGEEDGAEGGGDGGGYFVEDPQGEEDDDGEGVVDESEMSSLGVRLESIGKMGWRR